MVAVKARQPANTLGSEKKDDFDSLLVVGDGLATWRRNSRAKCGGILLAIYVVAIFNCLAY